MSQRLGSAGALLKILRAPFRIYGVHLHRAAALPAIAQETFCQRDWRSSIIRLYFFASLEPSVGLIPGRDGTGIGGVEREGREGIRNLSLVMEECRGRTERMGEAMKRVSDGSWEED